MNKFLKIFGVILLSVVVVGLILPNKVDIRRSVTINASAKTIHQYTNNLERWPLWSPWISEDPSVKTTLGDIHSGKGASQTWTSISGNGKITFTDSEVKQGIAYDMTLEGDPTLYHAGIRYQQQGNSIIATWYMTGEMKPIIVGNYFALLMDSLVGGSFEMGLEKLKSLAENPQAVEN